MTTFGQTSGTMKNIFFKFLILCCTLTVSAQESHVYDARLAESLGADDYGMKSYVLVILKTGNSTLTDTSIIQEKFRGHMENIALLAEENKLVVAGPLGKNDLNYRGIFIFNTNSIETAELWVKTDPAVEAGLLDYELLNWYGSAALPTYLETHQKISKVKP